MAEDDLDKTIKTSEGKIEEAEKALKEYSNKYSKPIQHAQNVYHKHFWLIVIHVFIFLCFSLLESLQSQFESATKKKDETIKQIKVTDNTILPTNSRNSE